MKRRKFLGLSRFALFAASFKTLPSLALGDKSQMDHTQMSDAKVAARKARRARAEASPQFKNGKFQNTIPEQQSITKALRKFVFAPAGIREPTEPIAIAKRKKSDFEVPPASGFRVTWLGHSTMIVEIDGRKFLTDPVWGERVSPFSFAGPKRFFEPPLPLSELPQLDAIVLSHDHFDHFCSETLAALKSQNAPFLVPLGVADRLEDLGIEHSMIREFDWWEEVDFKGVKLAFTPARHFSGRSLFDRNKTLWGSWVVVGKNKRYFFSGDTAMGSHFSEIGKKYGPFDLVAMESGAYDSAWPDVHIGPEQGARAFQDLSGKLMLPIHWATFNLAIHNWTEPGERLLVISKSTHLPLVFPKPGESFETESVSEAMKSKWWVETPWQTADQHPIVSSGLT